MKRNLSAVVIMLALGVAVVVTQVRRTDQPQAQATAASTASPMPAFDRSTQFPARIHAQVTGAAEFVWDGEFELIVNDVGYPETSLRMISVGMGVTVPREDDPTERFRWAFDLFNAYRGEPGIFTFHTEEAAAGIKNSAFLVHLKVADDVADQFQVHDESKVVFLKQFDVMEEPCTVQVGRNLETGELHCPMVATAHGERVGYRIRWSKVRADSSNTEN